MVGKSKAAAAAATLEEAPEAAAEAPAAPETPAPAEPAAEAPAEKSEKKDEEKKEESSDEDKDKKKKKKKKVVPSWATLSDEARSKLAKAGSMQKPKMTDAIVEAIKVCADSKGAASASSIRAMIMTDHPDLPKMVLKKAMLKAVDKGMVTQVKGKGFSGSFKLGKGKPAEKKAAEGGKKGAKKVNFSSLLYPSSAALNFFITGKYRYQAAPRGALPRSIHMGLQPQGGKCWLHQEVPCRKLSRSRSWGGNEALQVNYRKQIFSSHSCTVTSVHCY